VIVGQASTENNNKPFMAYDFKELLDKKFNFGGFEVIHDEGFRHTAWSDSLTVKLNGRLGLSMDRDGVIHFRDWENPEDIVTTSFDKILNNTESLQKRKDKWMRVCFTDEITDSPEERNRRFIEEALELVQSLNMSRYEAHFMVDYVFGRDKGEPFQEVGGAILTLATLCNAHKIDMMNVAETELSRVWTKVEHIQTKQKLKTKLSDVVVNYLATIPEYKKHSLESKSIVELTLDFLNRRDNSQKPYDFLTGVVIASEIKAYVNGSEEVTQ